ALRERRPSPRPGGDRRAVEGRRVVRGRSCRYVLTRCCCPAPAAPSSSRHGSRRLGAPRLLPPHARPHRAHTAAAVPAVLQPPGRSQNSFFLGTSYEMGLIWSRYSLVIIPKNWNLFAVNFFVGCAGGSQLYRIWRYNQELKAKQQN
uniref:Mitochondrial pyruvate carrier n=1 Tax=Strigops habroptila TaxID=2489341 RepID=A0A672TYP3_STRHB